MDQQSQQPSQMTPAVQQLTADRLQGCCYRPHAFDKMEGLVREMQDPENGVPVRSQKLFLTSIPSAFMGYDLIEWLMERLGIEESEALNIANQLCQYGYFFPVSDSKTLVVKDDSSLYRFQTPYYWPWQQRMPDNVDYAIYLAKRTLRNKQRHGLEEYELEALNNLRKNLQNKWDFIMMQAEEQVRLAKERKKGDKIVSDSQERAYWRVYRPPPGIVSSLEACPVPNRNRNGNRSRRRTLEDCKRDVEFLKSSLTRTRVKVSQALENMCQYVETYSEYDPLITQTTPSNPWVSEDITYWQLNSPLVEVPTEKRVRRWTLSMEELVSDPTGLQEFTAYLRKEYSHENIRFWMAVNDLRRSGHSQIQRKVQEIFEEFLAPGAPCEINIDGKTMEKVQQELKQPSRFSFDSAAEHVYTLLLKKDCYPRFIRSEHYKSLLASGIQPSHKKRFFGFGPTKKKTSTTTAPNPSLLQQQANSSTGATSSGVSCGGGLTRRRGSDRSLSGSAHELAVCGVKDTARVPHSHSQSNLSDIPYREPTTESGVCPWDETPCTAPTTTAAPSSTSTALTPLTSLPTVPITSISIVESIGNNKPDELKIQKSPADTNKNSSITVSSSAVTVKQPAVDDSKKDKDKDSGRSRKSSTALDSASSSSEISLAIVEVSDRLRRTVGITQQNTLDDSKLKCRRLSTSSELANQVRRSSISIIPPKYSENTSSTTNKPNNLLSSFEENSGSCTVLTNANSQSKTSITSQNSSNTALNSEINTDNKINNKTNNQAINIENQCAPIISVSSVIDENIQETIDDEINKEKTTEGEVINVVKIEEPEVPKQLVQDHANANTQHTKSTNPESIPEIIKTETEPSKQEDEEIIQDIDKTIPMPRLELAMAPLAVPDSESPCSECNPDLSETQNVVAIIEKDVQVDKEKDSTNIIEKPKDSDEVTIKNEKEELITQDKDEKDNLKDKDHQEQHSSQETTSVSHSQQQENTTPTTTTTGDDKELKTQKSQENTSSEVDTKQKEICPWEDEETCKHDVPFVKTYSTLGYL